MSMIKKIVIFVFASFVVFFTYLGIRIHISTPNLDISEFVNKERTMIDSSFFKLENNWLRQNDKGLWEMHLEGSPLELGVYQGKLSKELIYNQENSFANQLKRMVPSENYLQFLKYFIGWFNRDIEEYVPKRFIDEIYGVSLSTSDEFNYIADNYQRMLNYHGAHDIGHALKDLALVGCTSFAANQNRNDSTMVVGRNFDFYINDEFAKDKVIAFVSPDEGFDFAYVTWASFIGVVSGMNTEGITVTINAAKSDLPTEAKTPISILAREILQFSSNIEDAISIAKSRDIFVSESILVSSAKDDNSIIIEKSPNNIGFYSNQESTIVCSNHFQSDTFEKDEKNIENIAESASLPRQHRCEQLIKRTHDSISVQDVSTILRDTKGIDDRNIGLGNEKSMNQLISHHSVIFLPKQLKMWVSTEPYQLGEYLCYDLNDVFGMKNVPSRDTLLYVPGSTVKEDPLLRSKEYTSYVDYREMKAELKKSMNSDIKIKDEKHFIDRFVATNDKFFYTYELIGDYYKHFGELELSKVYFKKALKFDISNKWEERRIRKSIEEVNKR